MKKLLSLVLIVSCSLLVLGSCKVNLDFLGKNVSITEEYDHYYLSISSLDSLVLIDDSALEKTRLVKQSTFDAAVEKLLEKVDGLELDGKPSFSIKENEQGKIVLTMEAIQTLVPPPDSTELGCGIDHEHLFYKEVISK